MKKVFITLCFMMSLGLIAQPSNGEMKKHRLAVKESKDQQTNMVSLDTFFCAGRVAASIAFDTLNNNGQSSPQLFKSPSGGHTMISVKKVYDANQQGKAKDLYYVFQFPGLSLECHVKSTGAANEVYDMICQNGLINNQALDTVRVETFVILKKGLAELKREKPEQPDSVTSGRNKKAAIIFAGENIEQDGIVIGSFKESIIEGPTGALNKLMIYNSIGVLICTATETQLNSHDWRLLIDNRFRSLATKPNKDKEDIIMYLISSGLL
jgi:hypothetical protein